MAAGDRHEGVARLVKTVTNGPWAYVFEQDGDTQKTDINFATIGAAVDAVKPLIAALPGTLNRVVITAFTKE